MSGEKCFKCGASDARASCVVCKSAFYCNDICGSEDWAKHVKSCHVSQLGQHVDFVMVPEGFETHEGSPDYIVQCPSVDGEVLVEYALSDIGARVTKDVFRPTTLTKKSAGGVLPDFGDDSTGKTYGFSIRVTEYFGNDALVDDPVVLRGFSFTKDIAVGDETSTKGVLNEVVLTPNIKRALAASQRANPIDIDTTKPVNFEIELFQEKSVEKGRNDEPVKKLVFNIKGLLPPGEVFERDGMTTRASRAVGRFKRLFRSRATRESSVGDRYKTSMMSSMNGVEVFMVFIKDPSRNTAQLDDIYFKVPTSLFRNPKQNWLNASEWSEKDQSALVTSMLPVSKDVTKIDPCDLVDVTALCFHLESRIQALASLIGEEDEETFKREYMQHASIAKHYLSTLKPHRAELLANVGKEYEIGYKVRSVIQAAQELESIDALFKKRADRIQTAWYKKLVKDQVPLRDLIEEGKEYILFLKPAMAMEGRYAPLWAEDAGFSPEETSGKLAAVQAFVKKTARTISMKLKGQLGKTKGRARAVGQRLNELTKDAQPGIDSTEATGALVAQAIRKATVFI